MSATRPVATPGDAATPIGLTTEYERVRILSLALCEPLATEDYVVQSMPDVSPTKWHLAHTSWFFEQFLLRPYLPAYRVFHEGFDYLFNSYYEAVGPRHLRPKRGLLSRPTVEEIVSYRRHVDEHMEMLLERQEGADDAVADLVRLGLNHEQQHQELMLTDIKHVLSCNPLKPAYRTDAVGSAGSEAQPLLYHAFESGIRQIGATGELFCFDNETPRHRVLVESFALANRCVTNGEYLEFIRDGSYQQAALWLSDGWATAQNEGWRHPLYWSDSLDSEFTLAGEQPIDPASPVCHLSYYEADAFARWAGARLPTEAEWEIAAGQEPVEGNFCESGLLHPAAATASQQLAQLYGDVWEWTASPYVAYPGFRPATGALGEYNGKFMCNQLVLRGGSCATPAGHVRATYRNFFYPQSRWQFMGLRLARGTPS